MKLDFRVRSRKFVPAKHSCRLGMTRVLRLAELNSLESYLSDLWPVRKVVSGCYHREVDASS